MQTGGKVDEVFKEVKKTVQDKSAEVKTELHEIKDLAEGAVHEAFGQVRQHLKDYYDQGREKVNSAETFLESHVKEYPVQSLLIACGVGVVVSYLWRHRRVSHEEE